MNSVGTARKLKQALSQMFGGEKFGRSTRNSTSIGKKGCLKKKFIQQEQVA